jgi:CheY-like chemotaxis protein
MHQSERTDVRGRESKLVMIADDDADHRHLLAAVIRRAGFDVLEACDGAELLAMCAEHGFPDVVVTDLMMPRCSGFGVLEHLQQVNPRLPVVLMSAVGDESVRRMAVDLGAAAMFEKPFEFSALRELVTRVAYSA